MDAHGCTREHLARRSNVSGTTIFNVHGGLRGTSVDTLGKLADALGVDVSEFFRPEPS